MATLAALNVDATLAAFLLLSMLPVSQVPSCYLKIKRAPPTSAADDPGGFQDFVFGLVGKCGFQNIETGSDSLYTPEGRVPLTRQRYARLSPEQIMHHRILFDVANSRRVNLHY